VLGLLENWNCSFEEGRLFAGDVLVLYTDAATESSSDAGEEFGEFRLIEAVRRHRVLPPQALIAGVIDEVRQFNPNEQQDDITLIVGRCREKVGSA
jgi:serine phosphatase RsbU (regulator of sigma subunit)